MNQSYFILDEAEGVTHQQPGPPHRRRGKMSDNAQQLFIVCVSIVALAAVIFTGAYHIREANKEVVLLMMEKGYVKCVDVDGVTRLSPPERCKR